MTDLEMATKILVGMVSNATEHDINIRKRRMVIDAYEFVDLLKAQASVRRADMDDFISKQKGE
jgi:hypothetical protein